MDIKLFYYAKKINSASVKYNVKTVEEMLIKEKELKVDKNDNSGTIGLLWLTRGIELIIAVMIELSESPDKSMQDIGRSAYSRTLVKHHNAIMKKIFNVGHFCTFGYILVLNY